MMPEEVNEGRKGLRRGGTLQNAYIQSQGHMKNTCMSPPRRGGAHKNVCVSPLWRWEARKKCIHLATKAPGSSGHPSEGERLKLLTSCHPGVGSPNKCILLANQAQLANVKNHINSYISPPRRRGTRKHVYLSWDPLPMGAGESVNPSKNNSKSEIPNEHRQSQTNHRISPAKVCVSAAR